MESKFNPIIRSGWVVLILCLGAFVAIYLLAWQSENDHWLEDYWWLIIAVPVSIFDAVFLMALYSARDRYEKGKTDLQTGDYLVRWTYSQPEWERFLSHDWKRMRKRLFFAALIVIVLFMIIMIASEAIHEDQFWLVLIAAAGFVAIIVYFVLHYSYAVYQHNLVRPREVIIGRSGVSLGGVYTAWDTIGAKLDDVKIVRGDYTMLQFVIGTRGKVGSLAPIFVPVPEGKEVEAEEILRSFDRA